MVMAARAGFAVTAAASLPREVLGGPFQSGAIVEGGKDARLIARSARPADLETPVALLDPFLTPSDALFVRSHMSVPAADAAAWRLSLDGDVRTPLTLSLADLRQMPAASVVATLECAGNGRAFFDPPVAGIQWRKGAVGTVRWTGVRLRDLVSRAGGAPAATYVWMNGADRPLGTQPPFVRQIPLQKAVDPDTLVAYEMNGQPLSSAHGAPLRAVVPGWEGAYSVKWLNRLTVATREHDGFWVASAYKFPVRRVTPGAAVDARDMAPLTGLALKSLITRPLDGDVVAPGPVRVAGFAWAGDVRIARVDVSIDAGASWVPARLTGPVHKYAWRRFECDVMVSRREVHTVLSRATDEHGATQPLVPRWNPSGYLWNAPDRIDIDVRDGAPTGPTSSVPQPVPSHAAAPIDQPTYQAACRACHDDDLVVQQRLSADAWGRTVDKMVRWGARVTPEERGPLVEYLASRWGVR
jgi:DMSO/TMAO reductase YedYZ molybdopterin-dependent catalytic subunit